MAPSLIAVPARVLSFLVPALLPALTLAAQAAPVTGDERVAKIYDLGSLAAPPAPPGAAGAPAASPAGGSPAIMAQLVRAFVRPALLPNEDVQPLGERWLVLLGRAEQHAWVDRFLVAASSQQQQQVQIHAELYSLPELVFLTDVAPALAPPGAAAAAAAPAEGEPAEPAGPATRAILAPGPGTTAFRAALQQHREVTQVTAPRVLVQPNASAHVAVVEQTAYVRDFELEVTPGGVIADPIVDVVQDGFTLRCATTLLPAGAVGLALEADVVDLKRPIPTFETTLGVGQPVSIQLPEVLSTQVAAAVELPAGHLAVFALPALAGKRYLVLIEAATGPAPERR